MSALLYLFFIFTFIDSQTRAPHSLSAFVGRLLVIRAEKTNAATRRLFFLHAS